MQFNNGKDMNKQEQLSAVIDGIINSDDAASRQAFSSYVTTKTRELLGYSDTPVVPTEPVTESVVIKTLREMVDALSDVPVKFQGDKVIVDGKEVGVIQSDPTDFESGINFIENGNRFSKEFDTVEELFQFLISRYTKRGE